MSIISFFGLLLIISMSLFGVLELNPELLINMGVIINNDFISLVLLIISILASIVLFITIFVSILMDKRERETKISKQEREAIELEKIRDELRALKGEI